MPHKLIIAKGLVSQSAASKKSPRQKLLSAIMKELSGDVGDEIASAFAKGQDSKFESMMDAVAKKMITKAKKNKSAIKAKKGAGKAKPKKKSKKG